MHFREECKHGQVTRQCRCPGPKTVTVVDPCPFVHGHNEPPTIEHQTTELDDATDLGDPAAYASTTGEFAARWNLWTEERRQQFLNAIRVASERANICRMTHTPGVTITEPPDLV